MAGDWLTTATNIAKVALPTLVGVLAGPGAGAIVGKIIGAATGVTGENTPEEMESVLAAHPEMILAIRIKLLEDEDLKRKHEEAMLALVQGHEVALKTQEVLDVSSARQREIAVKDRTPENLAYLTFVMVGLMIFGLFFREIPPANSAVIYLLAGTITGCLLTCYGYYYGTTKGSENKTNQIVDLAKK